MDDWQTIDARVVRGHGVASGRNGDPRFPGGTIRMQMPHFAARGLDLSAFHPGTINVSIAPHGYRVVAPRHTVRQLKWHPTEPAEDFSFFDVAIERPNASRVVGYIYFPHPQTKPTHFQQPDVLELLLPHIADVGYDTAVRLRVPREQMAID